MRSRASPTRVPSGSEVGAGPQVAACTMELGHPVPGATGEFVAPAFSSHFRPYRSKIAEVSEVATWVQIDLGATHAIEAVRLYPFSVAHRTPGEGFPLRFRIECADLPDFRTKQSMVDWSAMDYPDPGGQIVEFPARGRRTRYVRLTVTRLRPAGTHAHVQDFTEDVREPYLALIKGKFIFELSKIEVLSRGNDIALLRPVCVDPAYGNPQNAQQLTRCVRPQGEGLVTDNLQNVTSPEDWRPVPFRAQVPRSGVHVRQGLFSAAMESNVQYLLESFTLDELLYDFRRRARKPARPPARTLALWDTALAGSSAGRFLMGAGNTVRWIQNDALNSRMNALVEGIAECSEPDGYIMAYSKDTFFYSERGAYTRAWLTHGLIEAGYAGNAQAFKLLRGYYDWYNAQDFLPLALRGCNFGPQGTVANTRMYFTPVGKADDLQIAQRYLQENYWLRDLAARKVDAVWQYPYDRPHSYLITFLEPYLDLYAATGYRPYLDAVLGGWDLFRDNWQNVGGSFSIIEATDCPPQSHFLYKKLGETCGSAFWIALNQRLHLLDPEEEKYVAEIEKSIYNVILANAGSPKGVRYHSMLVGHKAAHTHENSCCEGQGTRIVGSLPEYIYSIAGDGIYVNLFAPSSIRWEHAGVMLELNMDTSFPMSPDVRLSVRTTSTVRAKVRIRTPSWADSFMELRVNGSDAALGKPGSYVTLDRVWSAGDEISFTLPMAFRLTQYSGADQIAGHDRYALEYGPLLMAAIGAAETSLKLVGSQTPADLLNRLVRKSNQSLHFTAPLIAAEWIPYYEVDLESFSCFPIIETSSNVP